MNIKLLAVALTAASLLTGCMLTEIKTDEYQEVSLQKADLLPTEEAVAGARQKIVIFKADVSNSRLARDYQMGYTLASSLGIYLEEAGSEVVDRKIAGKLKNELLLAESKGLSEYNGPNIANFAITSSITKASLSSKFYKSTETTDEDGDVSGDPAHCIHTAKVFANIKVYALPDLKYSKTTHIKGGYAELEETNNSRCSLNSRAEESLLVKAAERAVASQRVAFQNFFSSKAYVMERRVKAGKSIFKLSTGKRLGFKGESSVVFYTMKVTKSPLTGAMRSEEYVIAKGTVASKPLGENWSWVVVSDAKKAAEIKLGDYVKVKHSN